MSTRLDERTRTRELFQNLDFPHPMIHLGAPSPVPRPIPARALAGAMISWMTLVFALCYVALPTASAALGAYDGVLDGIVFNLPAFVMASLTAVVGACVTGPTVRTDVRASRDPIWSAALGGLVTWGLVHNTSPFLRHFDTFGASELLAFLLMNIVEMTLIGMMLASFTRSRVGAFGLGALFQLVVLGTVLGLFAL